MDRTFKSSNEFLNLENKDLDKYYDSFNDNDIGIIKKIIFFYTTDEEFTKYYKNISNQKAIEKIKELGIFITNNPKNLPDENTRLNYFRKSNNKFLLYICTRDGKIDIILYLYRILNEINKINKIADFKLISFHNKFYPKHSKKESFKILGMCFKKGIY